MGFCYQKNFSNPTLPVDEAQFWALVRAEKWNENIDKYRETGDAALKRKLPAFIFQATFDETTSKAGKAGAWRKQAATQLTGLVVMDVDHVEKPREVFDNVIMKECKNDKNGILLVYITPSGKGLKIVFKARLDWGNLIDNQHAMAKVLGVEVDESCKDASRMSFICKESDILYLNKELFTYENKEFAERYTALYRDGHSQATREDVLGTDDTTVANGRDKGQGPVTFCDRDQSLVTPVTAKSFKGVAYSDIIDEWWRQNGGVPQEGERNVKLYQLAVSLRAICDNNRQLLMEIMPRLGLSEEEVRSIVESACKETPKGLSKAMRSVLEGNKNPSEQSEHDIDQWLWDWGEQIEGLFDDFPILRDVCKGLKRNQYASALFVSGGFMMTLMTRCRYSFYHRPEELRRLNCEVMVIGDPASGKSFATRLYKLLIAPIIAADRIGKDAINAYREQMKTKGANKEKPKKPKVVVRVHPARTSNAQFIQDMVNAVEEVDGEPMQLHMLTFDTELDNTLSIQKGGSWIDKQSLELKAFHNEEDGQAYSNMDSVIENFCVTWNFIYTGTPLALKAKINERNFGSGLATRLTCIPLPPTNFEMMTRESVVDRESDHRLKEWGEKLDRMKGVLSVEKIVDELYDWTARRMADAKENNSKAEEMLLKRCAYHGLNFAAPFIVMRHWEQMHQDGAYYCGEFETDEVDWKLAELIVNIQYACQRHFFLAMAEKYFDDQMRDVLTTTHRRQKTYDGFNRLPEEFAVDDVMTCFAISNPTVARVKISRLMKDHLIEKTDEFVDNGTTKAIYRKVGAMC
ncbi:VirE N-terminal domain-containing protein [Xylanibacter ruminicola]|uniref:VirE N-terminal domain-containing protein n=1 Tax=Xylanibacter ruminicola TaxID=839 RepID=A0A1M7MDN2_XYLRU|nr:BT4734/BF3469 family protein [Xylanibacter ruminicola]SFC21246.1 VirE N-terminal domain-containing protein [Xylanibacter ruminicola]SHM88945.1 VirE N-terminal domain-containing protein [Xylanibacter ruminicola]